MALHTPALARASDCLLDEFEMSSSLENKVPQVRLLQTPYDGLDTYQVSIKLDDSAANIEFL